jgi:hypothetical protein
LIEFFLKMLNFLNIFLKYEHIYLFFILNKFSISF